MFQLTKGEFDILMSQIAISKTGERRGGIHKRLRKEFEEIKLDIEDILHDQNDINESTRAQLDAISTALAELQADKTSLKPRRRIGFVQDENKWALRSLLPLWR